MPPKPQTINLDRVRLAGPWAAWRAISGIGSAKCRYLNHWQKFADDVTAGYIADMNALVYTSGNQHYNAEGHRQIAVRVVEDLAAAAVPGVSPTTYWPAYWLDLAPGQ